MHKSTIAFRLLEQMTNKVPKMRFTTSAQIAAILMLAAVFFSSCENKTGYKRAYIISKSDDDNWTTSGLIECDSFSMVSNNEVIFFVDGRKSVLKGQIIKCFSNSSYVSAK